MTASTPLAQTLAEVRKRIANAGTRGLNEQNTKATLIEPVLRSLGWDTESVDEVAREYRLKSQHKPVDYGLLALRTPRLFVEAKALGENLEDHRWTNQIMGYAGVAGVEWIVLTDGNEYRIYNSHAPVTVEEKLLQTVTITEPSPLVEETLELLSKGRLEENRLQVLWRAHFVDRQVRVALEELFGGDNDMLLVNHILGRSKSLDADDVRASLRRCKYEFDFPVSPKVLIGGAEFGLQPRSPRKRKKRDAEQRPDSYDVSLTQLIQAKILQPPVKLTCRYKRTDLTARILADGSVEWNGNVFPSLSLAGSTARVSIRGLRTDGRIPSTNGWTFWKYTTSAGSVEPLSHAREAYKASQRNPPAGNVQRRSRPA